MKTVKVVFVSDTHCALNKVKIPTGADLLIHSGDLTYRGDLNEVEKELDVLATIGANFKDVVVIFGNHDRLGEQNPFVTQKMCEDRGLLYLNDTEVTTEGLRIWGSPISPTFPKKGIWAFNADRGSEIKAHWDKIPEGLDVLVTHGPPFGLLDDVQDFYSGTIKSVGCVDLLDRVMKVKPRYHSFGHIHSGHGVKVFHDTTFINASNLNEQYKVAYEPIVIDIEVKEKNEAN